MMTAAEAKRASRDALNPTIMGAVAADIETSCVLSHTTTEFKYGGYSAAEIDAATEALKEDGYQVDDLHGALKIDW